MSSPYYRVTDLRKVANIFGVVAAIEPPAVDKLYHYQPLNPEYLSDMLAENRIHLSNPENFNDPWDCRPFFELTIDDESTRSEWGKLFEEAYKPRKLPMSAIDGSSGPWYNSETLLRQTIEQLTAQTRAFLVNRWRIYCLTPHPDSVLMWAHYAGGHRGVCLEFDLDEPPIRSAHRVVYRDTLPVIDPSLYQDKKALTEAILLTKSAEWSYEDEYRIARDGHMDPSSSSTPREGYLPLAPVAPSAIILGCDADEDSVRKIVSEWRPELPLKRAMRVPGKYHLRIKSI